MLLNSFLPTLIPSYSLHFEILGKFLANFHGLLDLLVLFIYDFAATFYLKEAQLVLGRFLILVSSYGYQLAQNV